MTELKAVHAFDVYESYTKTGDDDAAQVYLKSEADKVIAELEKEIDKLQDKVTDLLLRDRNMALNFNSAVDALVHNKYKRCLAMARWCHNQREIYERDSYDWELDDEAVASLRNKANIMRKWRKRWLELAERFKDKEAK